MVRSACLTCRSVAGEGPISPVPRILRAERWVVEHVGPSGRPGWMVLATIAHRAALHELTQEEWAELGELLPRVVDAVHGATGCESEYVAAFYERPGFRHVHWHVVPRFTDDPPELRGPGMFSLLSSPPPPPGEVVAVSERVRAALAGSAGTSR